MAGLYDFGPVGCAVKANLLSRWRSHFIIEEDMLEVDCTCVTPEMVLETSGHVAKFQDLMVKEEGTGACFRADHLLEGALLPPSFSFTNMNHRAVSHECGGVRAEHLEKLLEKEKDAAKKKEYAAVIARLDDFSAAELEEMMALYKVVSPEGKPVSAPFPFNLMFNISIGPTGTFKGYPLRTSLEKGVPLAHSPFGSSGSSVPRQRSRSSPTSNGFSISKVESCPLLPRRSAGHSEMKSPRDLACCV